MVSYYHVQYQKKLMIQSSENLVTNGQTDKTDFIGHCPTNVERQKKIIDKKIKKEEEEASFPSVSLKLTRISYLR